ncbi:MAG: tetratricopeptide repeat protein [Ignavibacteriae bacterium]|nr:tetratricopeptide repeat protein [Ignavibacteriota bacterium]MCI0707938.1 tetratricopeptide repeat protein [Ignavibacteriota bacterium]
MTSSQDTSTRKLAAIMFTDIKAFSWKMATDEIAAMQILKTHDSMMTESIVQYGGKVIKSIGDSFMVDFTSAVNAVTCAMELQRRFWEFNQGKTDFNKIEVRMGLHLGDVIDVGNDMYGDGVNIASRVEAITEPNRICITQDIYSQVKKKMSQLNVFSIGPMKFKNIDDPVEVYEILMDDIPELSAPSKTAKQAPTRKAAEKTAEREAKEAKSVEARRQKLQEQNSEKIKMHYKKAEIFFQKGKLDEAEAELAEIEKLTGGGEAAEPGATVDKGEEEKQKTIQSLYKKAEEAFHKGQLEDAEKAIQEIYRLVPMHYGAQMIMAQIEEERFKLAEERRRKIESDRRAMQEKTEKLDSLRKQATTLLGEEKFDEALEAAKEMLTVDADNGEAKQLRQRIQQQKKEKEERERAAAEEAERILQATLERRAEQAKTFEPKVEVQQKKSKFNTKLALQVVGALAGIAALYFIGVFIKETLFPNTATVAVVITGGAPANSVGHHVSRAMAIMLTDDFARQEHVTTASAFSALASRRSGKTKEELLTDLGVRQLVLVDVRPDSGDVSVQVELFDTEQKTIWEERLPADNLLRIPEIRTTVVNTVLDRLGVNSDVADLDAPTRNAQAYENYLVGLSLVNQRTALGLAIDTLTAAIRLDGSFSEARAVRALAYVEAYKLGGETNPTLLNAASGDLQSAGNTGNNALASLTAGMIYRYRQQFGEARQAIDRSLVLQPQCAASYRELALIEIPYGNYDEAKVHAEQALKLDPRNYESHITAGIVAHFRKEYEQALQYYNDGIAAGANGTLITLRYRLNAWKNSFKESEQIEYVKSLHAGSPQDYKTNYWLGRAYMQNAKLDSARPFLDLAVSLADRAVATNPGDATAQGFLALSKAFRGRLDEAQRGIESAIQRIGSSDASLLYRRAQVYAIQGEQGKAQAYRSLKEAVANEFMMWEILSPEFYSIQKDAEYGEAIVRTDGSN